MEMHRDAVLSLCLGALPLLYPAATPLIFPDFYVSPVKNLSCSKMQTLVTGDLLRANHLAMRLRWLKLIIWITLSL